MKKKQFGRKKNLTLDAGVDETNDQQEDNFLQSNFTKLYV